MRALKIFLFLPAMALLSCTQKNTQVQMQPVNSVWKAPQAMHFEFQIADAQKPKNIIFVLRNNNDYPYSNIFLITTMKNAAGKTLATDTVNYVIAEPNGRWLGTGFGSAKEMLLSYKPNFTFPADGKYIFEIKQGMRQNPLPGIEDIGIKIEQTKP